MASSRSGGAGRWPSLRPGLSSASPTSTPPPSRARPCASSPRSASTPTTRSRGRRSRAMPPVPLLGEERRSLDSLSPREIVAELNRWVVGQGAAKRAVAIALRSRVRRQRLAPPVGAEITPKNILMIGPTGVGKTEIARRLAMLSGSPFIKVEASKFTEVGYVGRDVDSIVRDLVAAAVDMVRRQKQAEVREKAEARAEERLLDLLLPPPRPSPGGAAETHTAQRDLLVTSGEKLRELLRAGQLEARTVEVDVPERSQPTFQILGGQGAEEMDVAIRDLLPGLFGSRTKRRTLPVSQAPGAPRPGGGAGRRGPAVSREGVQRDLLPIVEGTTVSTKYGPVRTDHVLFIAAGAF